MQVKNHSKLFKSKYRFTISQAKGQILSTEVNVFYVLNIIAKNLNSTYNCKSNWMSSQEILNKI